jgi:ankyrin repeat protein
MSKFLALVMLAITFTTLSMQDNNKAIFDALKGAAPAEGLPNQTNLLEAIQPLIDANPQKVNLQIEDTESNYAGAKPLIFYFLNGPGVIDFLIKNKVDINQTDQKGVTALHQFMKHAHTLSTKPSIVAQKLIDAGAHLNAQDDQGNTPLMELFNQSRTLNTGPFACAAYKQGVEQEDLKLVSLFADRKDVMEKCDNHHIKYFDLIPSDLKNHITHTMGTESRWKSGIKNVAGETVLSRAEKKRDSYNAHTNAEKDPDFYRSYNEIVKLLKKICKESFEKSNSF